MKKIFSLALVACMAIGVFAQQQVERIKIDAKFATKELGNKMVNDRIMDMTIYENGQIPAKAALRKVAKDAVADTAYYIADPNYVLYGGNFNNGYVTYPTINQPAGKDVTFYNTSVFGQQEDFGWFLGAIDESSMIGNDTDLVVTANSFFTEAGSGFSATPIFAMASGAQYFYGDAEEKQYWFSFDPEYYAPLTKCHMYTSTVFDEDGSDCTPWKFNNTMLYVFGTGLDLSVYPQLGMGLVDTIGTRWGFEGMTTMIDSINIMVMSWNASTLQLGSKLTMVLHPVTYDAASRTNYIDFNTDLAKHVATTGDITYSYSGNGYTLGIVTFPIKTAIKGLFFIEISGFNASGANIGLWSDGQDYVSAGDTYHISNGKIRNLFGMNAAITLNAAIDESGTMGVNNVSTDAIKATKTIRDGQLIIKRGDKEFNVIGAEL